MVAYYGSPTHTHTHTHTHTNTHTHTLLPPFFHTLKHAYTCTLISLITNVFEPSISEYKNCFILCFYKHQLNTLLNGCPMIISLVPFQ